jgi:hypothetical protein
MRDNIKQAVPHRISLHGFREKRKEYPFYDPGCPLIPVAFETQDTHCRETGRGSFRCLSRRAVAQFRYRAARDGP